MEKIIELTFNQGGTRGGVSHLTPGQVRGLARKVRPSKDFSGNITIKIDDKGVYKLPSRPGLLASEWDLIFTHNR
jgi:hypothetical protein